MGYTFNEQSTIGDLTYEQMRVLKEGLRVQSEREREESGADERGQPGRQPTTHEDEWLANLDNEYDNTATA